MNTAKQAAENMAYVRRLLKEKQAGFSAAVELAVSFVDRRIEWPEGNDGTDDALRGSHSASSADVGRRLK